MNQWSSRFCGPLRAWWAGSGPLLLLLLVATGLRVAHFATAMSDPYVQFRAGDEQHYHEWAHAIAAGEFGRGAAFFTTPLYAYVLGAVYALAGDTVAVAAGLNVLLGIATVYLVFLAARATLDRNAGLLAAALYGLCATPMFYETFAEKTTLVMFLTALALLLVTRALAAETTRHWLAAGAAIGVAALAHTLLLAFVPVVIVTVLARVAPRGHGAAARAIAACATGCLVAVSPATIHNYLESRDFVLINANGGQNFYVGNHAGNVTGLYTSPPFSLATLVAEERGFKAEAERRKGHAMAPSRVSRFWFREGWREIRQAPRLGLARFWRKIRWSVGAEELADTRTYEFYATRLPVLRLPLWRFGGVAVLGLFGLLLVARRRRCLPLCAFALTYAVGLSLFFVYGRYRLPLLVPFAILGAAGLGESRSVLRSGRHAACAALACALVAIVAFVYSRPLPGRQVSFFPDYFNQGNKYYHAGNYDLAVAEYRQAITVRPGDHPAVGPAILGLADLYVRLGRRDEARALLEKAAADHPGDRRFRDLLAAIIEPETE